jgi:outer membrane receptor for ferrienterochelin and colicins
MKLHIRIVTLVFAVLVLAGGLPQVLFGQEGEKKPESARKLSELTLADLLNMQVITASKQSESSADAPGIISVMTKDELERFGGTTLKDVLERIPGLIGSTVYMTDRSMIAARGDQVMASSSHVLLLINGRPIREVEEGGIKSEMYESFPINIIDRIEVIKGPGSVLYGSNAFSAVINVITEGIEKTGFSVSGFTDASDTYGALAKAKLQLGDVNVIAAGRIFQKPDWKVNYAYAVPPAGDTAVGVSIPDKGPGAYLEVNYKDLRFMSSFCQWDNFFAIPDYAFIFPAYGSTQWKKWFGDLGYKLQVSDTWNMDFDVTYTRSTFDESSWPSTNRDSYELVGEWTNFYRLSDKTKVVFGGLYNYVEGKEWGDPDPAHPFNDSHIYSLAGYAQVDYQVSDMVKLIGGLQANKVEGLDVDINPRLGVLVNPTKNINIKALYSQAFRSPSLNELGLVHPAMMGNPNLKPEKANTVDLGISYTEEKLYAEIDGFYSKMTNIIYQDRSGKYAVPTYDNIGEVTLNGIELEAKYYVSQKVFLTGSMLFQKSKDKSGAEDVTPIANFGAKAGISYRSANGVILSLFDIHQGSLDKIYSSQLNVSPGSYDILSLYFKLPLGHLFNLSSGEEVAVFVQADNLLNKEVWLPNWGLLPGTAMPYDQGRIVYIGLNFGM